MSDLWIVSEDKLFYKSVYISDKKDNPFCSSPIRYGFCKYASIDVYPPNWFERVILKRTFDSKKDSAVKELEVLLEKLKKRLI